MRGLDFIRVARRMERLSRNLPKREREAFLRRAISTLYYGVLWELLDYLESRGKRVKIEEKHFRSAMLYTKSILKEVGK